MPPSCGRAGHMSPFLAMCSVYTSKPGRADYIALVEKHEAYRVAHWKYFRGELGGSEGCGGSVVLLLCQRESRDCPFLYCHVPASCVKGSTTTEFEP